VVWVAIKRPEIPSNFRISIDVLKMLVFGKTKELAKLV
jgi:hypothetical protein